ncbi:MAG: TMEM175 family protein [Pseudomonadota bacterium]
MFRDGLTAQLDHDPKFRWRGQEVTRVENLADIVFALSLGMLVSSAEVPKSFDEIQAFLIGIVPVTAGFVAWVSVWQAHFTFFRRYALADRTVVLLNAVLLLLVLFVAYPLRFVFDSLFAWVVRAFTGDVALFAELGLANVEPGRSGIIMGYFATGYALIATILAILYIHALTHSNRLELNRDERSLTKRSIAKHMTTTLVASLVACLATYTPLSAFAGFVLFTSNAINLLWPVIFRTRGDGAP